MTQPNVRVYPESQPVISVNEFERDGWTNGEVNIDVPESSSLLYDFRKLRFRNRLRLGLAVIFGRTFFVNGPTTFWFESRNYTRVTHQGRQAKELSHG